MKSLSRILLLVTAFIFLSSSLGICAEDQADGAAAKKKILFMTLVRNKSNVTMLDSSQSKKYGILVAPMKEKLQRESFVVIDDPIYYDRLKQSGMDIQSIEKNDILELFKDGNFDYIYLLEQDPWGNRNGKLGFQSAAHLKLISVGEGKYLHNGRLYAHTTWGSAFATHRKIAEQINVIIDEKLLSKAPAVKAANAEGQNQ